MLTDTELIELPNDFLELSAHGPKDHRELSLLLLVEDKGSKEGRDQMELAFSEHVHHRLLLRCQLVLVITCIVIVV